MKALSVTQESCSEDLHLTGNVYRHLGEVHRALKSDAEAFAVG